MERLHSYWRMEYVEAPSYPKGENPFVALPKQANDRETHIIHRGKHAYLMLNLFPYNAGHLLAIPFREVPDLPQLSSEERTGLMDAIVLAQEALTETLHPDGFNIGFNTGNAAGASFPNHVHAHIVPRWEGDTNFMPVLADTRVLPTSLDSMWVRLNEVCRTKSST